MTSLQDESSITNVGDDGVGNYCQLLARVSDERKDDVLGNEVIFRLGSDSSPPAQNDNRGVAQNDNFSGNELMDGEDLVERMVWEGDVVRSWGNFIPR
jgi:hypothetical protein